MKVPPSQEQLDYLQSIGTSPSFSKENKAPASTKRGQKRSQESDLPWWCVPLLFFIIIVLLKSC